MSDTFFCSTFQKQPVGSNAKLFQKSSERPSSATPRSSVAPQTQGHSPVGNTAVLAVALLLYPTKPSSQQRHRHTALCSNSAFIATWNDIYCLVYQVPNGTRLYSSTLRYCCIVTKDRQHAAALPPLLLCLRNNAAGCSPDEVQAGAEAETRATDVSSVRRNERSKEYDVDRRFQCSHVPRALLSRLSEQLSPRCLVAYLPICTRCARVLYRATCSAGPLQQ